MLLLLVAADESSAFAFGSVKYSRSRSYANSKLPFSTNRSNNNNINWYASSYREYHDSTLIRSRRLNVLLSSLSIAPTSVLDTTGTTITTSAHSELRQQQRRQKNKTGCRIGGRQRRQRYPQQNPQRTTKQNTNPFLFWLPDEEVYATTITARLPYNFFNKELIFKKSNLLESSTVRDQRNQPWDIVAYFNIPHGARDYPSHPATDLNRDVAGLVNKNNKDMTDPINTNGAVSISVLYDEAEVYRGENNINSKIVVPVRNGLKGLQKGNYCHQREIYRGEKNKESRIVVTKGSIQFKNHSAEFQDGYFTQHGYGRKLDKVGYGGVLAEWPWNQIVSACDNDGKLTVMVDIEYKIVPRSIPTIVLERLQNYKVRYIEYDKDENNKK